MEMGEALQAISPNTRIQFTGRELLEGLLDVQVRMRDDVIYNLTARMANEAWRTSQIVNNINKTHQNNAVPKAMKHSSRPQGL
jgi:hypothetical protein